MSSTTYTRDAERTLPNSWSTDAYQYKPQNPALEPYWNAFYENPYPNAQEYAVIAKKLGWRVQMNFDKRVLTHSSRSLDAVQRWYGEARRITHASERGSSCDAQTQGDGDHNNKAEKLRIRGPLDNHFGKKEPHSASCVLEQPSKRDRSTRDDISHTENLESKKAKATPRGPRGPYTKQSRATLWRKKAHAHKHASNIQPFFGRQTGNAEECIIVQGEPDLETIASGSDDRVGSSKSTGRGKV